jgi:transposase InsO family protein
MSIRRLVVEVDPSTINVTEFCSQHGVSTWFFWNLRRRFAAEGEAGLEPMSRAAHRVANRTPQQIEELVVAKRKELVDAGLDAGPATIAFHLGAQAPSEATIWRLLKARGFIVAEPKKRPKHAGHRFAAERANECWQIDDTAWELPDGTPVKIINVLDDCTRVAVASLAAPSCTGANALQAVTCGAERWGWPQRFQSDNAKAFRLILAAALAALGISAARSRPHHPQTNGKVERFHLTLKRWLARQPAAATIIELQAQLDRFLEIYNHHRPHRGIGRHIPAEMFAITPKSGPSAHALHARSAIHRDLKVTGGIVCAGRNCHISLGAAHDGHRATVIITGVACHVFIDGRLVRALTIDPTKRHQTLYPRPGNPGRNRIP